MGTTISLRVYWHLVTCVVCQRLSAYVRYRVFSAYVKEVDTKPEATKWGDKMTFGTVMAEFSSSSGNALLCLFLLFTSLLASVIDA